VIRERRVNKVPAAKEPPYARDTSDDLSCLARNNRHATSNVGDSETARYILYFRVRDRAEIKHQRHSEQ
jgi:hypothetical protein